MIGRCPYCGLEVISDNDFSIEQHSIVENGRSYVCLGSGLPIKEYIENVG